MIRYQKSIEKVIWTYEKVVLNYFLLLQLAKLLV